MPEKAMELTVEQKAAMFDAIFTSAYENVIRIDASTGLARTLHASDGVWKRTLGIYYRYEDVVRNYLFDSSVDTDPADILRECSLDFVLEKLSTQPSHVVYYTIRGTNGNYRIKQAAFFLQDEEILLLFIRDVSESFQDVRSRLETLSASLDDAKKEISEKNAFLTLLNQNIRTPLYTIMGLTRLEEERGDERSFDDYLHKVSLSGSYMQETIDDVLSLRQIARHEIVLEPSIIHLGDFFTNIERLIRPSVAAKGLLFELDTSHLAELQIVADLRCLQQIVLKMLRTSIGHTVRGGRIRLSARVLFRTSADVNLELSVENRGIVIDQERLSLLFKPYDFIRNRLDKNIGELDIALIILRSYVLAMGSTTMTAESDERRGTRISVALSVPLADGAQTVQKVGETLSDFSGRRVLLVDDNDISLEVSKKLLINKGIEVVTAKNGLEAVDAFKAENGAFDLILMDVLMPVMDGLDAAKQIRGLAGVPGAAAIPIIALTVNAFRENFEESLKAGMNAHLVKPVEPERLYQTLSQYFKQP